MADAGESKPNELEKIRLLLSSEYSKLSAEVSSRINSQQQLYGMITPIVTGIAGAYFARFISLPQSFELVGLAAVILVGLWIDYDRDIAKAAKGIRRIEDRVNQFAGEDLLQWETQKGRGGVVGKHLIR
jgi:hypothetical protein